MCKVFEQSFIWLFMFYTYCIVTTGDFLGHLSSLLYIPCTWSETRVTMIQNLGWSFRQNLIHKFYLHSEQ